MKKYLMRGGLNPLEIKSTEDIIFRNLIGANSGNLLYAYGVYRTLLTEDTVIDMDYYGVERSYTDKDIERINREYDAYICPLADAFRDAFTQKLFKYANFFNKLTIPFYVIGMGMRSPLDGTLADSYVYDDAARAFMKAATRNGNLVGLRGATTAKYLTRLGFEEGKHFMVIGCPSMYSCGRHLPIRPLSTGTDGCLPAETRIAFNMSAITPDSVLKFLFSEIDRYPNHHVVEQNEAELRLLYFGLPYVSKKTSQDTMLPLDTSHPLLRENAYHFFVNVPSWREFMSQMDLCIGSKLHGNVAAVISGCPAVFIPLDGRMKELIAYHHFPEIDISQIREDDTIDSILQRVDMTSYLERHPENFDRFIEFLDLNGIDHIYRDDKDRAVAPLDLAIQKIQISPAVESILFCDRDEAVRRFTAYAKKRTQELNDAKKGNQEKSQRMSQMEKELKAIYNSRGWKLVQYFRRLRDKLRKA